LALEISGIGTLLAGINLITTVLKLHAPGMTYMRMTMYCWTTLVSNLLIVAAFPILTATLTMLMLDRYLVPLFHQRSRRQYDDVRKPHLGVGTSGGLHSRYAAFGIFSEVVSTFSGKRSSAIAPWLPR